MEGARSRHVSDVLMREIYLRDNGTCQKCSRAVGPRAAHFDHIIPWSEDGDTVPWNLQILCESCNFAKGNRMDGQDYKKLWELGAIIWIVHALLYRLDAPGLFANPSERKSAVRSVLLDLKEMADDIERADERAAQELAQPADQVLRARVCEDEAGGGPMALKASDQEGPQRRGPEPGTDNAGPRVLV